MILFINEAIATDHQSVKIKREINVENRMRFWMCLLCHSCMYQFVISISSINQINQSWQK